MLWVVKWIWTCGWHRLYNWKCPFPEVPNIYGITYVGSPSKTPAMLLSTFEEDPNVSQSIDIKDYKHWDLIDAMTWFTHVYTSDNHEFENSFAHLHGNAIRLHHVHGETLHEWMAQMKTNTGFVEGLQITDPIHKARFLVALAVLKRNKSAYSYLLSLFSIFRNGKSCV